MKKMRSGRSKPRESSQIVSAISVEGYKSIAERQRVEIRPLTILAGANSSGKSSVMQPWLLLKQTLEATFDPGPILINGSNVRLTSAEQLLTRTSKRIAEKFSVGFEQTDGAQLDLTFGRESDFGIDLIEMSYQEAGKDKLVFKNGLTSEQIAKLIPQEMLDFPKLFEPKEKVVWSVQRERCFFSLALTRPDDTRPILKVGTVSPKGKIEEAIRKLIHLPGLRGNPERNYLTTGVEATYPGQFQDYVASIIRSWKIKKDSRLDILGDHLERLGLTWKIDADQINDTQVDLRVGRMPHAIRGGGRDLVSIADVGFGLSQTLPVVVSLLAAEPGQIIYLEQPEIHLHPLAQLKLADLVTLATKKGVIVIAETHSNLFLLGVQTLVAEGYIEAKDVKLHWFKRDPHEGLTTIQSGDLDDEGAYGKWPQDFGDVRLDAETSYLNKVTANLIRRKS
jgi:predicted ATPase